MLPFYSNFTSTVVVDKVFPLYDCSMEERVHLRVVGHGNRVVTLELPLVVLAFDHDREYYYFPAHV